MDFNKYYSSLDKKIIKISLPPDKEELEKAFWAGFRYYEELEKLKKNSGGNDFGNIFGNIFN